MILGAVYTANLVALISVPRVKLPFTSLQELVEQTEYTFGILGGTSKELTLKVN